MALRPRLPRKTFACLLAVTAGLALVQTSRAPAAEGRPARRTAAAKRAAGKPATPPKLEPAKLVEAPKPPPSSAPAPPPEEDPLSVYALTFGPGDHPFFKFGHNAILVRDAAAGTERVYNFGTFKFDSPWLIPEFMRGRLTYWLSVSSLQASLASYQRENRSILAQELVLAPDVKRTLQARLEENARPENRAYRYDYFLDNCSTRVRDVLDRATGGFVHAASRGPGRLTLRDQALRLTADYLPLYVALDVVLAGSTDRPIDRWAEMFIPEELARGLRAVSVPGPNGTRPLVSSEKLVFQPQRAPPLEYPPARGVSFLLAGLGLGLLLTGLGWLTPGRPFVRALFGGLIALWGLVAGFVGCFLIFVWFFTDHVVAHRNENILQLAPWALALAVLGLGVAGGSYTATRRALPLAVSALVFAVVGLMFKVHPAFHQSNWRLIAFAIPVWVGISLGLMHVKDDPRVR
jgi:hypothetical protein